VAILRLWSRQGLPDIWLHEPGWQLGNDPALPSSDVPDSEFGGLVNILDRPTGIEWNSEAFTEQEIRQVQRALASVTYLPSGSVGAIASQTQAAPGPGLADQPPNLFPQGARVRGSTGPARVGEQGVETGLATGTHPRSWNDESAEGGLVALLPSELIKEFIATEVEPANNTPQTLDISVQMDTAYGKFQAFEVSTAEPAVSSEGPDRATGVKPALKESFKAAGVHFREGADVSLFADRGAFAATLFRAEHYQKSVESRTTLAEFDGVICADEELALPDANKRPEFCRNEENKSALLPLAGAILISCGASVAERWAAGHGISSPPGRGDDCRAKK
jgi:hypothetical protein